MAFCLSSLSLFILLGLLLLKDGLHLLTVDAILVVNLAGTAPLHQMLHHVSDLFHEEGNGPLEEVHALRQMEGVLHIFILFNVHFVVFNQNDRALVVVFTAVVWRAKHRDD